MWRIPANAEAPFQQIGGGDLRDRLPEEHRARDLHAHLHRNLRDDGDQHHCPVQGARLSKRQQSLWALVSAGAQFVFLEPRGNLTVLIVEDNPSVRRLLRRLAGETAHVFWECCDGDDALAAYQQHRPDVVLMDIRMPRMDGLTATRQIVAEYPEARVVIVSDYEDDELKSAASDAGASSYLAKQNLTALVQLLGEIGVASRPETRR